ncbi:probable cytochrome P450 6a14 [Trichoplusia ni]|uniref:unspecific monooxygenase n=1 Tax=Trichoplusia ni TaxID=7111 RepID=A0A7E5VE67_TRINI|nr:probable cytochrome P450 6a14 [Trichoplusia ni]
MLLIILITILSSVLFYLILKPNNYWKKRNVLQVGDIMLKFMINKVSLPEICKKVCDEHKADVIGTSTGTVKILLLTNPQDIQAVLTGDFQKFHSRGFLINQNDLLSDNLLFMNDIQKWKMIRQKLTPVFTSARLKNMFYIMDRCARDFVDLVDDNPLLKRKPYTLIYTYTTAAIGASVFGIDTQAKSTMDSPYVDMIWKALSPSLKGSLTLLTANLSPTLYKFLKLKFLGDHEDFFINVMKNVFESRKNDTEKRHDFIEICLELKKQGLLKDSTSGYELEPSDELLAAQAFFFFIAGADTSGNVIHFALVELASKPKMLARLHKEIDEVFEANKTDELAYEDLDKMQYLDMVVSESMRKYPPIGIIQRVCTRDSVLPSGVSVEKDVLCMVPVLAVHRDEKNFPNPEEFDPERFAPENVSDIKKYTYLPFGEGNRHCLGARFARVQVKAGLARLLRRFTLTEQELKPVVFEKSTFGLRSADIFYDLKRRDI